MPPVQGLHGDHWYHPMPNMQSKAVCRLSWRHHGSKALYGAQAAAAVEKRGEEQVDLGRGASRARTLAAASHVDQCRAKAAAYIRSGPQSPAGP